MARRRRFEYLLPLVLLILSTCKYEGQSRAAVTLPVDRLGVVSLGPLRPSAPMRWPQFLLVQGQSSFLWGGEQGILRIEASRTVPALSRTGDADLFEELDRPIAASFSGETWAVLDALGHVAGFSQSSGRTWFFQSQEQNQPGALALTKNKVYLLLQGTFEEGNAVVAYTFTGDEVGRWGTMPAGGLIQASLQGGGIAACPNGSVFYSYINSPRILRLAREVRPVGKRDSSFQEISAWRVHSAYRESLEEHSVAPMIKLGFRASRVMSLFCSSEGLLLRQVARPHRGGALVEVWNPRSEELLGTLPIDEGVLLGVVGRTLYLGTMKEGGFVLERARFSIETAQGKARSG